MMKHVLTFDVGTTEIKGVIVSEAGELLCSHSEKITMILHEDHMEQSPDEWYQRMLALIQRFQPILHDLELSGVIFSGQMQDLILVDENQNALGNAILYSDSRAAHEVLAIKKVISPQELDTVLGNQLNETFPFPKLLWVKNHQPERFQQCHKFLISAKDYCVLKLTGEYATDTTSGATSGVMDIRNFTFKREWLEKLGLNPELCPRLLTPGTIVGKITASASRETGLPEGIPVFCGSGDAGATTLASGIREAGEININLGTSGWVAAIGQDIVEKPGVFNLVEVSGSMYINVVPLINAGNVHQWITRVMSPDDKEPLDFGHISTLLNQRTPGSGGVLFLPYLQGERFPLVDETIRGCYYGISPQVQKVDLISAALEGVAFSLRQGLEALGVKPRRISIIGGGAREKHWGQILADVLESEVMAFEQSAYLPAAALSSFVFASVDGKIPFDEFAEKIMGDLEINTFTPRREVSAVYQERYAQYLELYPRLKGL